MGREVAGQGLPKITAQIKAVSFFKGDLAMLERLVDTPAAGMEASMQLDGVFKGRDRPSYSDSDAAEEPHGSGASPSSVMPVDSRGKAAPASLSSATSSTQERSSSTVGFS